MKAITTTGFKIQGRTNLFDEDHRVAQIDEVEKEEIDWNEDWTDDEERIFAAFLVRREQKSQLPTSFLEKCPSGLRIWS
tara:strand:+ start:1090 stop:1326 length:237 start_codon:yes stop_codon:yes gene_type:complete